MKKFMILAFIISQVVLIYAKTASVNIRFLMLTHPDFKKFDFSKCMFTQLEDALNKDREEFAGYENMHQAISEQQSLLKQKLQKDLDEAKTNKWPKEKIDSLQKKFDNTFSRLLKKLKSVEKKLESFTNMKQDSFQERADEENLKKFQALRKEIIGMAREYAIKRGYSELINTSSWRRNINEFNSKYRIYPTMHNLYGQYFKSSDVKNLDGWFSDSILVCSKKMMYNSDFILFGGEDITFALFYKLRKQE